MPTRTTTLASGQVAAHDITLIAGTIEEIKFPKDPMEYVEVLSDGAAKVYFTVDGTDPTVGGTNTFLLPAGGPFSDVRKVGPRAATVKLISAGTPVISVESGD